MGRVTPRALAYGLAAASFFMLGVVVYRDDPESNPGGFTELSEKARAGRVHWREQNCNACHMLYGFGGYLGPDLTHVVRRVDEDMFKQIIHAGTGQMPAGMLEPEAAEKVYAFLSEMDTSGQGHMASAAEPPTWARVFEALGPASAPGVKVFETYGCGQCHEPFRLGHVGAPDMSRALERMSRDEADATLRRGRGNMPSFGSMTAPDMELLLNLMETLNERRAELSRRGGVRSKLTWFNYEPAAEKKQDVQPGVNRAPR